MSVPDPSRAYQAAAVQVSLNLAAEALNSAFVALIAAEGLDDPRTRDVAEAQRLVSAAMRPSIDWHPPR